MRWSQTLIPTQKQDPADATIASHKLLVRGGFVRQLQAGVYDFLPLGWRSLHKAMKIIREEMDAAGAAEVFLPVLQPIDLWDKSGRNAIYGDDMVRAKDRKGAINALAPTHEECVTELIGAYVNSHKQLPLILYQIQTKFRDEPRPRSGLLRVREFHMKDAYSFDKDQAGLDESYRKMFDAYVRIYQRSGIPAIPVEAESGAIGGSASHEFTVPCAAGEDIILSSDKQNYAANIEKAETGKRPFDFSGEPTGELEKVHTPNLPSIEEVGKFMKVNPKNLLKTLLFAVREAAVPDAAAGAKPDAAPAKGKVKGFVAAVVRGDHDVNEAKLAKAAKEAGFLGDGQTLDLDEQAAREAGFAVGYVGPQVAAQRKDVTLVVDYDAAQGGFWATGANEKNHHVKHFNWQRDLAAAYVRRTAEGYFQATGNVPDAWEHEDVAGDSAERFLGSRVAADDIRNAVAGDPSPLNDGGVLRESKGVEVGHVFKLGTRYSEKLDALFLDEHNQQHPVIMGCYGIGVGRILISAVETGHDERGIIWPVSIAPYEVVITPIKYEGDARAKADELYDELKRRGVDVLLDDRDDRPGSKFADADLIGIPLRIVVGDRGLANGVVELKERASGEAREIPVDGVVDHIAARLGELRQSLDIPATA